MNTADKTLIFVMVYNLNESFQQIKQMIIRYIRQS
jgi:hypothetical protein